MREALKSCENLYTDSWISSSAPGALPRIISAGVDLKAAANPRQSSSITREKAGPHPSALFSLVPTNNQTRAILAHANNGHLVSLIPNLRGPKYPKGIACRLNIGFHIGSKSRHTLATLGRNGADIVVEGSSISRIHCSFEIHKDSRLIMLYDRSTANSSIS